MIVNIKCLIKACKDLNIKYEFLDTNSNYVKLNLSKPLFFVNSTTPFNNGIVTKIAKDKEFTYMLLNGDIKMPATKGYLDPKSPDEYQSYLKFHSEDEITTDILNSFKFPLIVKMNSGSEGRNVFLCKDINDIKNALKQIHNQNSMNYDYVALAQEYISAKHEYRAVVYEKKVILLYEKDKSNAEFTGNLSPLHWKESKAIHITDNDKISIIEKFLMPLYEKLEVGFAGLDILEDENSNMYLIEINSSPGFSRFVKDNGEEPIINMFTQILKNYHHESNI